MNFKDVCEVHILKMFINTFKAWSVGIDTAAIELQKGPVQVSNLYSFSLSFQKSMQSLILSVFKYHKRLVITQSSYSDIALRKWH